MGAAVNKQHPQWPGIPCCTASARPHVGCGGLQPLTQRAEHTGDVSAGEKIYNVLVECSCTNMAAAN